MKIFQFLLIFAVLPTLIFGIKCAAGGICYDEKESGLLVDVPIKTCKDACVYFKCFSHYSFTNLIQVREGMGCLEDFLNVCKYTLTKYKDEIKGNIKKYSIENEDLVFKSCEDKDGCVTNGLTNWTSDNVEFNIGPAYHSYNKTCKYNGYDRYNDNDEPRECYRRMNCKPGKWYFAKERIWFFDNNIVSGISNESDACLSFKCSNDGGNTVIEGYGSWNDFEYACQSVPSNVKEKIKININDSFYFDKNYIIISCNSTKFSIECDSVTRYFLFIFAAFPIIIFGIDCAFGGKCYGPGVNGKEIFVLRKTCNDSCVYFKCISPPNALEKIIVTEGAGCFEDFVNICEYIPTKYKDEIQSNLEKYSVQNEVLIFKSCSDKDGCATNGFDNWNTDNSSDGIFGSTHSKAINDYLSEYDHCIYIYYGKKKDDSPLQCDTYIDCRPARPTADYRNHENHGGDKKCDGCLHFKCTNDGGNTVISGGGCFDDFEYACPIVPSDVREKIKANIKDSFYYDKNYIVASSNSRHFRRGNLQKYASVNPKAEEIFQANLNKDYGEECHAEYPKQNTAAASGGLGILTIYLFAFIYF